MFLIDSAESTKKKKKSGEGGSARAEEQEEEVGAQNRTSARRSAHFGEGTESCVPSKDDNPSKGEEPRSLQGQSKKRQNHSSGHFPPISEVENRTLRYKLEVNCTASGT